MVGPLENMDAKMKASWEACLRVAVYDDDVRFIVESAKATQHYVEKHRRGELTFEEAKKAIAAIKTGTAIAGEILKKEGIII